MIDGKIPLWERKKILTPRMMEMIALRERHYTKKEIAEKLGTSFQNVKRVLHRSRGRVKNISELQSQINSKAAA